MQETENKFCADCPVRQFSPFHAIPDKEMEWVQSCKQTHTYQKGEHVFLSGDSSDHFYALMEGSIQVYRGGGGREQSFAIARPGTWIGYRDAIAAIPFQNSARVLAPSVMCRINREVISVFVNKYTAFTASLLKDISIGWVDSEHQCYNLGARKTVERLADFLLGLKNDVSAQVSPQLVSEKGSDSEIIEIDFPLTRETVATLIGTTTESVIRSLSDFKARGWIEFTNGKIRLTNEAELKKLVVES